MSDSGPAIHMQNLSRSFGTVEAVRGLSLEVQSGEIFGLVGPDGAGKTSVMRMLASVLDPTSGDAWVAGAHTVKDAEKVKRCVAYMSQRFGLYPDLTVEENIHFYADLYGVPRRGREDMIRRLLAFSDMEAFRRRQAGRLSGGMKQKLGLVCCLVHTPRVLLLDEPTNGVDPVSRRDFWKILYQMVREGVTVFVSTAYLDEAERCAHLALLHQGKLLAMGTPDQVKGMLAGELLELQLPQARTFLPLLREILPEAGISLFGDRVHLLVGDAHSAEALARRTLSEAGAGMVEIRPVEPTLEDVFVSVIGNGRRSHE